MEEANGIYSFVESIKQCYQLLQDDLSRKIFEARIILDFNLSPQNIARIVRLGEQQKWLDAMKKSIPDILHTLKQAPKKLILYGTNVTGHALASFFMEENIDFYGFCGRRASEFPDGLLGKPVISPNYLFQHADDFYVVLAVGEAIDEIMGILRKNHFPQDQILSCFRPESEADHQYFEFPSLFHRGTAFVDGGCLDCRTSYRFADWCDGEYTKIFAFEPDPISCTVCEKNLAAREIRAFRLVRSGLSDHDGEVTFRSGLYGCSHIAESGGTEDKNLIAVPVTTIDRTVGAERVGFIKMDIEGAEFDALHGTENVIIRDKPLLAISVYHRTGDILAIMDYLRRLVPEYHFWLRHSSIGTADTVLYASVDRVS